MLHKFFLFFFLFFFFSLSAFSAVFVVTSNADSGPGTLRDALTQAAANGSAEKDYINFNLPDLSEAGRTITILTDLPNVSSNVVIDGSSQPGVKFGVSDAKVAIIAMLNSNGSVTCCFNVSGKSDIDIYGFLMDSTNLNPSSNQISGIYGILSKNITIGAPGKGNITKSLGGIMFQRIGNETDANITTNIKISSNILGLNEDGETIAHHSLSLTAVGVRNLTLGGNTPAEGNIFVAQVDIYENGDFNLSTGALLISNNFFGTNISGTKAVPNGSSLSIFCPNVRQLQIAQNLFVSESSIGLSGINCFFHVTGNKFGTDITGTSVLGTIQYTLIIASCNGGGIIGGTNPGDGNIFSGAYTDGQASNSGSVVSNLYSPTVELVGNSFRCNKSTFPYGLSIINSQIFFVKIANRSPNTISGTATPNSRVDLYYSLSCDHCEPEKQFTSTNADANGNWRYNGALSNFNIIASSTSNGTTSEFTSLRFLSQPTDVKIKMACGDSNGSIKGIIASGVVKYTWYNSNGNVVATTRDLNNMPAGRYYLIIDDSYCSISSDIYEIKDATNQIDATNEKVIPASCDQQNGSIIGIRADPSSSVVWTSDKGRVISYSQDLTNVVAGGYTLTVTPDDGSCSQKLGPIIIKNTTGPNIDQSNASIQPTNCGQSTGSITNLAVTGSGTLKYTWLNSRQQTVSTAKDLLGQPAGTYKLGVTDDSQCGPVYTKDFTIPETNGITMDETKATAGVASCSKNNGSITGITVTGATKYIWTDASGHTIITVDPDFLNVASGDYTLTASNTFGCSKTSRMYHVGQDPPTQYQVYASTIIPACFGKSNGSVSVATDLLVSSSRWIDGQGAPAGSGGTTITDVPAGAYQLYVTDKNGCENLYNTYTIKTIPQLQILSGSALITDDACALHTGSITSIQVNGGLLPYSWSWLDSNNQNVSSSPDLTGVGAGVYTLNVNDASGCGLVSASYTIQNKTEDIPAPAVSNLQLCSAGDALLQVSRPSATYSYRLYDSPAGTTPIDEQVNGNFKITVKNNTSYYVTQVSGDCESPRVIVQVSVGITAVDIANAFTPNGDGINDYWVINGISNYPATIVQVFTRNGQNVFESNGYAKPFDGTYSGKRLPAGVYYYIINLRSNCNLLSGSLTIIR